MFVQKKKKLPTVVVLRYEKGQTEALFMVGRGGRQHPPAVAAMQTSHT